MKVWAVGIVILAGIFAGCLGGDPEPEADHQAPEAVADEQHGSVFGKVLTTGLEIIEGASVAVVEDRNPVAETTTDPQGRFTINELEPGDYRLQVTTPCCRQFAKAIEVVAGERLQVDAMLQSLSGDDLQRPYVEEFEWEGFIGCAYRLGTIGAAPLGCADANHDDQRVFEVDPGVKTISAGIEWEPTVNPTNELLFMVRYITATDYIILDGTPPMEGRVDAGTLEGEHDLSHVQEPRSLRLQVWAGGEANVVYQQPFTVHYKVHYWEHAPEGQSVLPDG